MAQKKNQIQKQFGNIDIYIFDQILKGRFDTCEKILDVGCGSGRNLIYFLQNGFNVFAMDKNKKAINEVKALAQKYAPNLSLKNFQSCNIVDISFEKESFDFVICNAVLHFAKDEKHFKEMLFSVWSMLKSQGYLLIRLASDIGIKNLVRPLGDRNYLLPDGSTRFLINDEMIKRYTKKLNGQFFEKIKTTNVQNLRCMTTWCIQKR